MAKLEKIFVSFIGLDTQVETQQMFQTKHFLKCERYFLIIWMEIFLFA